ncbi:MAG: phytoene/squalene synthase family protein [Myxococcales bacterium]|nr:phytoene/squalene synthase family protein [Myxococcales bacterium]
MSAAPDPEVLAECRAILARGSKSFATASRLLPSRLRDPVAAYYAFCRVSDDAVDESDDPMAALEMLRRRLDAIVADRPGPHAADRGLAWVMDAFAVPRAPIDALLEGYAWDVEGRRFETLSEVRASAARVAASVGVVMTLLMGRRERWVLHRAADLGVAMQLTNIARDVGEDARAGRLYLPMAWLRAEGIDPDAFVDAPRFSPGVGVAVCRLLDHAAMLYRRADAGVSALPRDCRLAIFGASVIYEDIGRVIRARGYDSVSARAYTTSARKVALVARAAARLPRGARTHYDAPPLDEVRFLADDVC